MAAFPVDLQRFGLPAAAIQRDHKLRARSLAQRLGCHERFELADKRRVPPESEVCLDPLLERLETKRLDPGHLDLCKPLVGELRERPATKETKRFSQSRGRPARLLRTRLSKQALEPVQIERTRWEDERVAGWLGLQHLVPQHLPKSPYIHLERLRRPFGRGLPPKRVDQLVDGDDLVRAQQQRGKQHPLLRTAKRKRALVEKRFDWPQDPELDVDARQASLALRARSSPAFGTFTASHTDP